MKRENVLVLTVIILSVLLAFQTGYLFHAKKSEADGISKKIKTSDSTNDPASRRKPVQSVLSPFQAEPLFSQTWDPFEEMDQMHKMMNKMLHETYNRGVRGEGISSTFSAFDPDIDVKETPDEYVIRLDLPGIDKDKISVKVHDGILTISGERQAEAEEKSEDGGVYRMERSFGSFSRSFPVPQDANMDAMTAQTKNGVLTIKLPKLVTREHSPEKKVTIQ